MGLNGIAEAVEMARGFYIVEADDDVVAYPQDWLRRMVTEFCHIPRAGYLAANVVQDEKTTGHKPRAGSYREHDFGGGVILEEGPAGGWCSMTSLETLASIGNFARMPGRKFFLFDGEYAERCAAHGWRIGVIKDVVVYHAAGPVLSREYGYLDLCEQKYSESPEFSGALEVTRRVRNEG